MIQLFGVLLAAKLVFAALAPLSTPILFTNSTTKTFSLPASLSSTPPLKLPSSATNASVFPSSSVDTDLQDCTAFPLDYRTGYWWSQPLPTAVVGTIYTIIDDSTNTTTTSTQQFDQVVVTKCDPDCNNAISREIWTENRTAWSWNGTLDVSPSTTVSDSMRLLDGTFTTVTYPSGIFDVDESFYWRGTVSYVQGGSTTTVSNTGPSSAPGYQGWPKFDPDYWLPPSALPDHDDWANMTIDVDSNDPYGHNYVFMHNEDCDFDMEYMLDFFHDPAISAEWHSCRTPISPCAAGMIWVKTVNYLLDSTTIHTGKKSAVQNGLANENPQSTQATRPQDTRTRTAGQAQDTRFSPTRTAAPGSPLPHKTPKDTGKTETTHTPRTGTTRQSHGHPATETTRQGTKHTRTSPGDGDHGGDVSTKTRLQHGPQDTPLDNHHSSIPVVINIGTNKITRNSDSEYVLSGTTLAPGSPVIVGSGPSATTIAMSTQGQHTILIIDGEKSTLGSSAQPTGSAEYTIDGTTLGAGSSVVVFGDTYSIASDGSTVFVNGHPENIVHSISLGAQTWVTSLSNGMLLTKTLIPEVDGGAITTLSQDSSINKIMTQVTTMPALIFGSKTVSVGSHITVSGTTYRLGSSVLYVNGNPTALNLDDNRTLITLQNGTVVTETEATVTMLLPAPNATSSTTVKVTEASNIGIRSKRSTSLAIFLAGCTIGLIIYTSL